MSLAGLWTRERVVGYAVILALGYLALVVLLNLMADQQVRDRIGVLATDYTGFHSGALVLAEGPAEAVFDGERLATAQRRALVSRYGSDLSAEQHDSVSLFHWRYPPPIFFLVRPLAEVPAVPGYYLWGFALLAPLLLSATRIVPGAVGVALALAMPATFLNFMFGQNGALTAGLIGLGLALADRRPLLAGVAVGLLCYKPQFAVLFPLVFLAGGNGRAFLAATVTVAAVVGLSVAVYGVAPWLAFLHSISRSSGHLEEGNVAWTMMPTTFAALRLWLPAGAAHAGQAVVSLAAGSVAVWLWGAGRRDPQQKATRNAAFCLATLLVVPFAFLYDLAILTPALLWLGRDFVDRGARRGEWSLLVLTALLPFYAGVVAKFTGVQVSPAVIAASLALTARRSLR